MASTKIDPWSTCISSIATRTKNSKVFVCKLLQNLNLIKFWMEMAQSLWVVFTNCIFVMSTRTTKLTYFYLSVWFQLPMDHRSENIYFTSFFGSYKHNILLSKNKGS